MYVHTYSSTCHVPQPAISFWRHPKEQQKPTPRLPLAPLSNEAFLGSSACASCRSIVFFSHEMRQKSSPAIAAAD